MTKSINKKVSVTSIVLNNFKNDSRVLKENISLQKAGFDVKVIALHEEPLKEIDCVQNIPVHRIVLKSRGWPKNTAIQLLKYIEFVYKVSKQNKESDIVHCNDLNTLPVGVLIKIFLNTNAKIVYDAHEYEINDTPNENTYKIKIKYFIEKFLIRYADQILTVSDAIADAYVKLYQIPRPTLILNTPPYQNIVNKDLFRRNLGIPNDKTIFLYQGGLSSGRGIEVLLETFTQTDEDSVVVFMGYGSLVSLVREYADKYINIYFHEAVQPNVLLEYTSSADFGILFYENNCLNHDFCSPNKMFEYLMAEIPVIVSNLQEMKRLVNEYNIGVVADENSVNGLHKAVKEALNLDRVAIIENIRSVKKLYNWKEQEKVLLSVYKGLV